MNISRQSITASLPLRARREQGWRTGFANLLRNENRLWWGTRRWFWQVLIWLVVINGTLAAATWGAPRGPNPDGLVANPAGEAARALILSMGVLATIGVLIMAQSTVVGEKRSGTAAWILSKPVSRSAVILSKLIAYAIGTMVTIVVVQGVIAYTQLSFALASPPPLGRFVLALALVGLNLLFYLCLTLMLGTFADTYAPVIGVSIAVLLAQELFADNIGSVVFWLPVALTKKLAQPLIQGEAIPSIAVSVIATLVLSIVCIAVAIWRFEHEDF